VNLYPVIDLLDGKIVRMERGQRTATTVYETAPVDAVRRFAQAGARWIHVVDLNRAYGDGASNLDHVRRVIEEASRQGMRVQVGGGLRAAADLEAVFVCGAARVVVGTIAAVDPELLTTLLEEYGGRLAVAVDARDGEVVVKGWTQATGRRVDDVAGELARKGVRRLVYTDVGRAGLFGGPDIEGAGRIAQATALPVIASGGVGSLDDVRAAAAARLDGLIVGKALWDGRVDLAEAVAAAGAQEAT